MRPNERGIAMVLALFMMAAMSVIATSLMFVSQTETLSSHNYRLMSQARYGAESGVHAAANYLLFSYAAPSSNVGTTDAITAYDTTVSPVRLVAGGATVKLSTTVANSTYPVTAVKNAFATAAAGSLNVRDATVNYTTEATLLSMREFTDGFSGSKVTIQTWEISAVGAISGARNATVAVTSTLERQPMPLFSYAAFATYNGCAALSFAGGAITNSYDSSQFNIAMNPAPTTANGGVGDYGGNVGSNGNLTEVGNTTHINGSMSTPRAGVGACTSNNVTAETISGGATVSAGLSQLSQSLSYPPPENTTGLAPGTNSVILNGATCPFSGCSKTTVSGTDYFTFDPVSVNSTCPSNPSQTCMALPNVTINGTTHISLKGGNSATCPNCPATYVVNSLSLNGNSVLDVVAGSGPVRVVIVGTDQTTPLLIEGGGISNSSYKPENLQITYGGTGNIQIGGQADASATIYAPRATASINGGSDLWGAITVKQITATGGASIHYDRHLQSSTKTAGTFTLSAFSWKSY